MKIDIIEDSILSYGSSLLQILLKDCFKYKDITILITAITIIIVDYFKIQNPAIVSYWSGFRHLYWRLYQWDYKWDYDFNLLHLLLF